MISVRPGFAMVGNALAHMLVSARLQMPNVLSVREESGITVS